MNFFKRKDLNDVAFHEDFDNQVYLIPWGTNYFYCNIFLFF